VTYWINYSDAANINLHQPGERKQNMNITQQKKTEKPKKTGSKFAGFSTLAHFGSLCFNRLSNGKQICPRGNFLDRIGQTKPWSMSQYIIIS